MKLSTKSTLGGHVTYSKECTNCSNPFEGLGPASRYCPPCKLIAEEAQRTKNRERNYKRRREAGCKIGRGMPRGKDHWNYKDGSYTYETIRRELKEAIRFCERCSKDLETADHYEWVVHHKDHDHYNNDINNLELLCKRCHQIEHKCWENFPRSE